MASDAFKQKLEEFRTHYKNNYDIELDNEALCFFIRVHEMQLALSKQIKDIPRVKFEKSWDYFFYALGSSIKWLWVMIIVLLILSVV